MSSTTDITSKVRALLNKSENTDNEHERDAFLAKAQEMMERHAISMAQIEASRPSEVREPVEARVEWAARSVGKSAKGSLAVSIAKSNRCQVVAGYDQTLVFQGMPEDVDFCVMLYTSLCLQAEQAYDPRKKPEWTHGRTYRASFFEGYASRVRARIDEQARARRSEARSSGADLVLVGIEQKVAEKFGRARYGSRRVCDTCGAGRSDGAAAGARADLSAGRTRRIANRKELTA